MNPTSFKTMEQLEQGIEHIRQAPKDEGKVVMIVSRPKVDQREVLESGELTCEEGLAGDNWLTRRAPEEAMVDVQLTLMVRDTVTRQPTRLVAIVQRGNNNTASVRWQQW